MTSYVHFTSIIVWVNLELQNIVTLYWDVMEYCQKGATLNGNYCRHFWMWNSTAKTQYKGNLELQNIAILYWEINRVQYSEYLVFDDSYSQEK